MLLTATLLIGLSSTPITTEIDSSIRAIEAVNDYEAWFAGSNGLVGHTIDGGRTWATQKVGNSEKPPHFRGIATLGNVILLMEITKPAQIYRSQDNGATWRIVYKAPEESAFFDAIKIDNNGIGFVMGDPSGRCPTLLKTVNAGRNWTPIKCHNLPTTHKGEGGFAASNSNLAIIDNRVWFVTGGQSARVFKSDDLGHSWNVFNTPMIQGNTMTGIYSVDFKNKLDGIAIGGDWENKTENIKTKIITRDGGITWQSIGDNVAPGYRSWIKYRPNTNQIYAIGSEGINLSTTNGTNWQQYPVKGWLTGAFSPSGKVLFMAGKNKVGKVDLD